MRLSTDRERNEAEAISVLHAALDAGVRFFDTSDAYCWDHTEIGHNERLIAGALRSWTGDASAVSIATKGGLTRPQGAWVPDGRARHLYKACEASCRALGVTRIRLYQFHAVDPRTPLATSVRALDALKRDGLIEAIGLCNVNLAQLEEARSIADIAAVQVELSVWNDDALLGGVAEYAVRHGLRLIAARPLGGVQRRRRTQNDAVLKAVAAARESTPVEIALAWVRNLADRIVAIPGPTRVETARSAVRGQLIVLTEGERARLDERFPSGRILRSSKPPRPMTPSDGEVVLIMGLPGAGKSTVAERFVERGYARLNRDQQGTSLRKLVPHFEQLVASGASRIVLDNTYVSRKSRAPVIAAAMQRGLATRCVWVSTSVEDAQVNAASRMIGRYGRLLNPDEIRQSSKRDARVFGPSVQFRYQRELEPPKESEGFSEIEVVSFERAREPSFINRALILWCDGVLRAPHGTPSQDERALRQRGALLRHYEADAWHLCGIAWRPEIAGESATTEQVDAEFARMQDVLGVALDVLYCPHAAGPPVCWCRKPLPGLGLLLIERYKLDASRCIYVGAGPQDPGFARRLGFQYRDAGDFFSTALPDGRSE